MVKGFTAGLVVVSDAVGRALMAEVPFVPMSVGGALCGVEARGAADGVFYCTRSAGHEGRHVAHGASSDLGAGLTVLALWGAR